MHHCIFIQLQTPNRFAIFAAQTYFLRRIFAIFAILLLLFTHTELRQLAKLPVLLEHYREHKGGGMNFIGFLKEHYFNGEKQNPDYERDMQLPFKTPSFISAISLLLAVPEQPLMFVALLPQKEAPLASRYSEWMPATALQDIFQPPRAPKPLSPFLL